MKIRGVVEAKRVARGSKSEHGAIVLRAGTRELWLRRRGGPSFGDASLLDLVGKRLACEGTLAGPTLILDEWKELGMTAKRKSTGRSDRRVQAIRTAKRALRKSSAGGKGKQLGASAAVEKIRHVVLLMLENRSFDHMLGSLEHETPAIDGVLPPNVNEDENGVRYAQAPGASHTLELDPGHELANVCTQLAGGNSGFVRDYAQAHAGKRPPLREVMAYFEVGELPALHALARSFVVCDHWHSSVPGPTWTNRLFAMSGTSRGYVDMPNPGHIARIAQVAKFTQPSLFKRLEEAGVSHRIYHGDFPLALLLADRRTIGAKRHFARFERFLEDARGNEEEFPQFSFIEPSYLGAKGNSDHPPQNVLRGQVLIAQVYNALRRNRELWHSTLLIITYDEHGGFHDHVSPPPAVPPDAAAREYDFKRLGVRVPALLISPWLAPGVCNVTFDHTSVLKLCQEKWAIGSFGARAAQAQSPLAHIPLLDVPRADTLPAIPVPAPGAKKKAMVKAKAAEPALTGNEEAIVALSKFLEAGSAAPKKAAKKAALPRGKSAKVPSAKPRGSEDEREAARARVAKFLGHR